MHYRILSIKQCWFIDHTAGLSIRFKTWLTLNNLIVMGWLRIVLVMNHFSFYSLSYKEIHWKSHEYLPFCSSLIEDDDALDIHWSKKIEGNKAIHTRTKLVYMKQWMDTHLSGWFTGLTTDIRNNLKERKTWKGKWNALRVLSLLAFQFRDKR